MAAPSLSQLKFLAERTTQPNFAAPSRLKPGGVDPLGLRQINFDLMDLVLPGLNNVARHVRPFVLVAWAWRRAAQLAKTTGRGRIEVDTLRDFADRIEVIYAWSQFLRDPNADLPGRQVLGELLAAERYVFGGSQWRRRRDERRDSTSFMAAITYGPGLKMLGWIEPHHEQPDVLVPTDDIRPALDAFENQISDRLSHPAFNKFGTVTVTRGEAQAWSKSWSLGKATVPERRVAAEAICGARASAARRSGIALMLDAAHQLTETDTDAVRRAMCGAPSKYTPRSFELAKTSQTWRRVQVRQLFRLALEALFYWIVRSLQDGPQSSHLLVTAFLFQAPPRQKRQSASEWIVSQMAGSYGPTELLDRLQVALGEKAEDLVPSIVDSLAFCLSEASEKAEPFERPDRLPLARASYEFRAWSNASPGDFVRHIIESWVLAQHVYWSVGRGLADARANGKTLLRLKVVLDEGGWTLAPGAIQGAPPVPTADRLQTALSLASECQLLTSPA